MGREDEGGKDGDVREGWRKEMGGRVGQRMGSGRVCLGERRRGGSGRLGCGVGLQLYSSYCDVCCLHHQINEKRRKDVWELLLHEV